MPSLCSTPDTFPPHLLTLLFADILTLIHFLISHPLLFTYLMLFSPYLLSLLSFLSPLLFSTSLFILLGLLIASPQLPGNTLPTILAIFKTRPDDDSQIPSAVQALNTFLWDYHHTSQNSRKLAAGGDERVRRSMSMGRAEHIRRSSESLQRDGSMRREKEWKRTLACKLYEERITFKLCEKVAVVADKGEEMDLLWEAYEVDANKIERRKKDEEEEDGDVVAGHLCCLQAMRLSARKMNAGAVTINLVKVSKVLKGMGWIQSVRRRSSWNK